MSIDPYKSLAKKSAIAKKSIQIEPGLCLHYRHDLPGELTAPLGFTHHLITFFLTQNQRQIVHFDEHGEYDGKMAEGEFYLYPAAISGFTSWKTIDETLHLIIEPNLLSKVATETGCLNPEKIELLPVLKTHDPQMERLVQLFLTEMQGDRFGGKLYLESLSDVLAIHILRNYCVFEPEFRSNTKGLAPSKLRPTIDYIQSNLATKLSLEAIAKQVGMSRYYFSTQFKQAMGISPHQYINQQRIDRARRLLKQTERSLVDISMDCGFASQSHFNKVFRQYVNTTPKKYREQI